VRNVGNQLTLLLVRSLEALEHRVHGPGESPDLISDCRLRDPAVQVHRGDPCDFRANDLDWTQGPSGEDPDQGSDQDCEEAESNFERPNDQADSMVGGT
jgi:hypothetical protein